MPVAIRMKRYAAPVAGSCLLLYTPIERNEREAADFYDWSISTCYGFMCYWMGREQ